MDNHQLSAALALTTRLVAPSVKPLSAREYWQLDSRINTSRLFGMSAADIAVEATIEPDLAERVSRLLDRGTSLAIALEKLDHAGVWTISPGDERYPRRLRERLGDSAPVVLHGVGEAASLNVAGIGVVGSRNVTKRGAQVAETVARLAVEAGLPVVSGAAKGVDSHAMNSAYEHDGSVVGILADSLERKVANRGTRQGVMNGRICLVTQYSPKAPFSVGNAMGRNKIIYAFSRLTVVVASDESGGTWSGATEAIKSGYGTVASWMGDGNGPGNQALVDRGAIPLTDLDALPDLSQQDSPAKVTEPEPADGVQLSLGF